MASYFYVPARSCFQAIARVLSRLRPQTVTTLHQLLTTHVFNLSQSNSVFSSTRFAYNEYAVSFFAAAHGQAIAHDMVLTHSNGDSGSINTPVRFALVVLHSSCLHHRFCAGHALRCPLERRLPHGCAQPLHSTKRHQSRNGYGLVQSAGAIEQSDWIH